MKKLILRDILSVKSLISADYKKIAGVIKIESGDYRLIIYADFGNIAVSANGKSLEIKQGSLLLFPENYSAEITAADNNASALIIGFECLGKAASLLDKKIISLSIFEKTLLSAAYSQININFDLKSLAVKETSPSEGEQFIKNSLELLLICLITDFSNKKNNAVTDFGTEKNEEIVNKIIKILEENLYFEITLEDIASELFFSKTYIKSVFKKQTGTTVIQYYINLKIEEAKKLISERNSSFTEIALKLNFGTVYYFSRIFKKKTGITPSEFKKSVLSRKTD